MKFEQIPGSTNENEPEKVEDTRLSEEEAHNEANILRARMKVSHHSGTIEKKVGRSCNIEVEPTAEDYDQALKEIENLRQLAEEEPGAMKMLHEIGRIAHKSTLVVELIFVGFQDLLSPEIMMSPATVGTLNKLRTSKVFEDAVARLKRMKKEGIEWGEQET